MEWIGSFIIGIFALSLVFQVVWCASLSVIVSKNDESDLMQVLAWIPLLQMVPMIVVGGGSVGRFLMGVLGFIVGAIVLGMASAMLGSGIGAGVGVVGMGIMTLLGLFYFGRLFWNTATERDLTGWVGLLLFVPIVNLFAYPYIAFHDGWELPNKFGLLLGLLLTFSSFAPSFQAIQQMQRNGSFPKDAEGWAALAQDPEFAELAAQMAEQNALKPTSGINLGMPDGLPSSGGTPSPRDSQTEASIQALFTLQERFDTLERATSGANLQDPAKRINAMGILQSARAELEANRDALGGETYTELATHLVEIEALLADPSSKYSPSFTAARQARSTSSTRMNDAGPAAIARSAAPAPVRPLPVQVTGDCAGNTELRNQTRDGHDEEWCEQNAATGGLRHGWYAKYLENGQPISIGEYRDGLRVGVWTRFYPSGSVRMQAEFSHGLQHGWLLSFDESGDRTQAVRFAEGAALR